MSAVSRCYHPRLRRHQDDVFLLLPDESDGIRPSQNIGFRPIRKDNVLRIFTRARLSARRGQIWLRCISMNCKQDAFRESMVGKNVTTSLWGFQKGLILANSMMLVLPFQTLAETCKTDYSMHSMGLLFAVSFVGAAVGGWLARKRKGELKQVNDKLRQINETLRRQAKIESYAPDLSYAPVGKMTANEVVVNPRKEQLISSLRTGKSFLRMQNFERATADFRLALDLAQSLGDHAEEKKAARGLGASLQRQGKFKEAIMYYSRVLAISKSEEEDSAATEAYGAIADCYTELGDLERAAKFYDKYIIRLEAN